jgi:hypothetical protein
MNAAALIGQATAEGVTFSISPTGTIKVGGNRLSVERWIPIISQLKEEILVELRRPELVISVECGGSAWKWEILLLGERLILTTNPYSTMKEIADMYPSALKLNPLE